MAGILDGLDIPKWMTPEQWSLHSAEAAEATGRAVSRGVGNALSIMGHIQQADNSVKVLALKKDEFNQNMDLDKKKFDLAKQKQDLLVQAQHDQLDDTATTQRLAARWHAGEFDAEPDVPFKTAAGELTAQKLRSMFMSTTADGKAEIATQNRYASIVSHDPMAGMELKSVEKQFGRDSPEYIGVFKHYGEEYDRSVEAQFAEKQKVLTQGRMDVAAVRGANQLAAIDERGIWGGYQKTLGGRAPNKDTFLRGSVHDILARDAAERKVLVDTGKPAPAPMTYEEAVGHAESVWNKHIEPSGQAPKSGVRVRRKSDGAEFDYQGNAGDVPTDQYELVK